MKDKRKRAKRTSNDSPENGGGGGSGGGGGGEKGGHKKKGGFQAMGFSWQILKSIINSGYNQPTPIQRKAIPEILLGKDVVAMARTGSGKTAAFLLPMFQRIQEKTTSGPKALIMSPTRELALQTFKFTKQFGKYTDLKAAVILGGDKIEDQFETMHENPDIIIATPGRFLHICIEMSLKLNSIEYVVFDEADRLFEMGFKEQLNEILHKLPTETRQTLLFSATLPQSLVEFARAGLQNPVLIRLDVESKLSDKLKMAFLQCRQDEKLSILMYLLNHVIKPVKNPAAAGAQQGNNYHNYHNQQHHADGGGGGGGGSRRLEQTLIFVATKHHVEFLRELLEHMGYHVSYAYSALDQAARQINIAKFQAKKTSIMVVTDVAARGIDIPMLDNVINFNFPAKAKLFVHRVGRVARAGEYGTSISLVTNDELPYMHDLFEFLAKPIRFAGSEGSPDDWNDVFGSVPQALVDIEKDSLQTLVDSKEELSSAFRVQENAYKHYIKSRPLPSAASVRAAKHIRQIHTALAIHPLLKGNHELNDTIEQQTSIFDQLKNYTTRATIFEINKSVSSQKSALVMRKKRDCHDKVVEKFKSNELLEDNVSIFQKNMYSVQRDMFKRGFDDNNNNRDREQDEDQNEGDDATRTIHTNFNDQELVIKITNNDDENNDDHDDDNNDKTQQKDRKSKRSRLSKVEKRKKAAASFIDAENFIPYKPKNFNQEKALGINTNFHKEIGNAAMDLVVDDQADARRLTQKTKWDRKKKKFVSMQSTLEKSKKIKTESGSYINASYKSDLYSKWLKTSKAHVKDDDDDNNDGDASDGNKRKGNKKFFGSSLAEKKFFGSHKFKSTGKPGVKRFQRSRDSDDHDTRQQQPRGRRGRASSSSSSTDERRSGGGGGGGKRKFNDEASSGGGGKSGNKRFKAGVGLKNKDQIMKERNRKAKVQSFQNRKKSGGGGGGGGSKGKRASFKKRK